MKKITLLVFSFFITILHAQDKISIGILPFTYEQGSVSNQNAVSIQETVSSAFVKTNRFLLVDRSKLEELKKEKELQKTEDFMDGSVVDQSSNLGAQYLVSGHVISASASEYTYVDSKTKQVKSGGYKAKLLFSLQIIDVSTGQVVKSENFEPKGGSFLEQVAGVAPSSAQGAISKAIKDTEKKIDDFISENFPVTFEIVEIQEVDKKGNAMKALISGGSYFGLRKGDKLIVIEKIETEVGGKIMIRNKNIGELRIVLVEDANFSICEVRAGGVEINSKFEAKTKLFVITQ